MHTYTVLLMLLLLSIKHAHPAVPSPRLARRTQPGHRFPDREPPIRTVFDPPYPESRSASEHTPSRSSSQRRRFPSLHPRGGRNPSDPSSPRDVMQTEPWGFHATGRRFSTSARALPHRGEEGDETQEVRRPEDRTPRTPRTPHTPRSGRHWPDPFAVGPASGRTSPSPELPGVEPAGPPLGMWRQRAGLGRLAAPSAERRTVASRLRRFGERVRDRLRRKPREPPGIP